MRLWKKCEPLWDWVIRARRVGNLLPAWVKVVCVDINPSTVIKLSDRGSFQTIGNVTDVGLFGEQLADELDAGG